MKRQRPLTPRLVIASGVLVAIVAGVLALLLLTSINLRDSSRAANTSQQVLTSASTIERLVIDLETGVRGYVITREPSFLGPWETARLSIPAEAARLERLVSGNPMQAARARQIAAAVRAYITDYSAPLVQVAKTNPTAARTVIATAAGKRRIDAIRTQFAGLIGVEQREAQQRRDSANASAEIAIGAGAFGLAGLVGLVALFALYVTRAYAREQQARGRTLQLQEITAALSGATDATEVAMTVARQAIDGFDATHTAVALTSAGSLAEVAHLDRGAPIAGEALEGWWGELERSWQASGSYQLDSVAEPGRPVAIPLESSGQLLGALAIWVAARRSLDGVTRDLMLAIGQQSGQALERAALHAAEQRALAEARFARDRLDFLARASEVLSESLDFDGTLRSVADLAVPQVADWCSVDLAEAGTLRNVAVAHADPDKLALARELQARYPPDLDAPTGAPNVIRTGQTQVFEEIPEELLAAGARDEEHLRIARELGLVSALVVPLIARGRTLGAITFVFAESGRRYAETDRPFFEDLAARAALAIDNARLYGLERGTAETLQRSLLPDGLPELAGVDLAAAYVPAESELEVGGDWYDVIPLAGGAVGVVIGDVVGHGIRAAAVMGQLRSALRAYAIEGHSTAVTIDRLNAMLAVTTGPTMVGTALLLIYDPLTGKASYSSAGHLPMLLRAGDGTTTLLEGGKSAPLGVRAGLQPTFETITVERGSTFVLFTDGLVERRGQALETGLERLREIVAGGPADADELRAHILSSVQSAGATADDTALVIVRATGVPASEFRLTLPAEPDAVAAARRALARWLSDRHASEVEAFELLVAVGDACTKAVELRSRTPGAELRVAGRAEGNELVIDIEGFDSWQPGANVNGDLRLVSAFTDSVEIEDGDRGARLRMRRRLVGNGRDGSGGP